MTITIIIFVILILYVRYVYVNYDKNDIVKNLEEYAKKEKIKQQKSQILECGKTKRPKRKTKKWLQEVKTFGINEAKWRYATEWCTNNGMEFKILTEDHLNIRYK